MQKTQSEQSSLTAHRKIASTPHKSRKNMKRPTLGEARKDLTPVAAEQIPSVDMSGIHEKMRQRTVAAPVQQNKQTAQQIKQHEIQKALKTASATPKQKKSKKPDVKFHFGFGRIMLALACAAAAVFAIVYFVNLNSPDISLKVAAMQTGIEASYPSYIPRDFSLSDITSENGKVTLNFSNSSTGDAYTIIEEKSSWDSNALLSNFVKKTYGEDFTTIRENGLTIYIHNSDATWVNGGVVYKLQCKAGSLTKKQLRAIAVSL
ncbi:hypothetical protein IKF86_02415 [Candidatus Saccharibacteria bacterium]|nr:hypothetical protein [Candidatus Saccharibacteria bacterium]